MGDLGKPAQPVTDRIPAFVQLLQECGEPLWIDRADKFDRLNSI